MAKGIDLSAFYREEVEPQLWEHIGEIFSDFKRSGRTWISPFKLDGVTASHEGRKDKTYIGNPQGRAYTHIRVAEQGGESIDLLELIERRKGLDFAEAVKYAAGIVGREVPQGTSYDQEKAQKHKEKQQRLEAILSQMKAALFSPEGEVVLRYLKEGRGYSEEYIKAQPFGYIDIQMECFSELRRLLSYYSTAEQKDKYPYYSKQKGIGVGITNKFAIAYVADGEIKGFAFRSILSAQELQEKGASKYYSAYIGEKETQAYFPMATPSGKLTAYSDKYLNFTIVEGELDTYRGLYAGLKNVVGLSQGSLTAEQLQRLKKKGAESITLLLDTEALQEGTADPEKSRRENREKAAKAVNLIATQGLSPYVLYLPSEHGEKVDIDEYFKGLEGDELQAKGAQLQEQIDSAEGGFTFLFSLLAEQYSSTGQNLRDLRKFLKNTLILTQREECDLIEQKVIYERFAEATGHTITAEDIEDSLSDTDTDQEEMLRNAQNALQEQISKASEQFHTDPEKTLQALKTAVSEYESAQGEDLSDYVKIKPQAERKREQENAPVGIYTDFTFYGKQKEGGKYHKEKLLLPSDSLTYICAPSGHGKTRLLENLALQVLRKENDGSVLFFTLEESLYKIENAFLNLYINEQLSDTENNILTIKRYKSEADPEKQRALFSHYSYDSFLRDEKRFNEEYIDSGRLRIYYENSGSIGKIERIIHRLKRELTPETGAPIKAVFIDYIQRLKAEGNFHGDKKQEMNAVTGTLMSLSVEMKIPFVLSVQLNRQAVSPLEMNINNIADAAEIERSGSVVMLLYNPLFPPVGSGEFVRKEQGIEESEYACTPEELQQVEAKNKTLYKQLREQVEALKLKVGESENTKKKQTIAAANFSLRTGIELGKGGKLYALLAKNRDSQADIEAVLTFAGNTGAILQGLRNIELKEETLRKAGVVPSLFEHTEKKTNEPQPQPTPQEKKTEKDRATQAALNVLYGKQQNQEPTPEEQYPLGEPPENKKTPF